MRSQAIAIVIAMGVLATLGAGCGRSGHGAETDPEKGSDAAILNTALGQELTALDLYVQGLPRLNAATRPLGRRLRSQEQEYVDALTKAIRGLGGEVEAEAEHLEQAKPRSQADVLSAAFGLESTALASYLDAASRLFTTAPRTLAAALAAGHSQHLVVLRQAMGADVAASIPEGFDSGAEVGG